MRIQLSFCVLLLVACGDDDGFLPIADAGPTPDSGPSADAGPSLDAGAPDVGVDSGPMEDAGPVIGENVRSFCDRVGPEWIEACIVDQGHVVIHTTDRPPRARLFPMNEGVWNMNGWEWWQKWAGGFSPTYEDTEATTPAMICSVASAIRFAAILENPPTRLAQLRRTNTWDGRFFNWNDDFSDPSSSGTMRGAGMWAWQDHLIKWMSQTNEDGSCELPTAEMLESTVANCIIQGRDADGHIEGCTN
ncbi:MAG: hypothetical protein ACI9KE_004263 [Polyangiales bacterium]|jgi:hypothetical protein